MASDLSPSDLGASPAVARRELSIRLRGRRRELGISVARIVEQVGLSRTRWSQIENDHSMISPRTIPLLADLFELGADEVGELVALRKAAGDSRSAWWLQYDDILSDDLIEYYGLESGARAMQTFSSVLVNGILQTEEYAQNLIEQSLEMGRADWNRLVSIRMERQRRLRGSQPLQVEAIMTEAVLRYEYGSPALLRNQLHHLANLIQELSDTLVIRIVPFSAPPGATSGAATYVLLDFLSEYLPMAVWQEAVHPIGVSSDIEFSDFMKLAHQGAVTNSLSREDSLDLLLETAKRLGR